MATLNTFKRGWARCRMPDETHFSCRAIQNLDFSIFKNFAIGEGSKKIQLRADFYNAFNHPQYVPGSIDGVEPIATTGVSQINTVGQSDFDVASHVFSSHPRVIQLAVRFDF